MNKPRGKSFQVGNPGGPGRTKGGRNKSTRGGPATARGALRTLMAKQIKAAYAGDPKARQWCLDQVHRTPPRARSLKLPELDTLDGLSKASDVIVEATVQGHRTPADGVALMGMVEEKRKQIEDQELVPKIEELQQTVESLQGGSVGPKEQ